LEILSSKRGVFQKGKKPFKGIVSTGLVENHSHNLKCEKEVESLASRSCTKGGEKGYWGSPVHKTARMINRV